MSANETITHLAGGHRRHPRGRQLDGQRDAVEAAANIHDGCRLSCPGQRESLRHKTGALNEQSHGGGVGSRVKVQRGHEP